MKSLRTRVFLSLLCLGVLSAIVLSLANSVEYKPYGVPDLVRPQWDAIQQQIAATNEASKAAALANRKTEAGNAFASVEPPVEIPQPIAVTDELDFDFGTLDPGTESSHTFIVRNEGSLPLIVSAADTSCKCTVSKASKDVVQPGDHAEVTLTWNTGTSRKFYRQFAIVKTNDPKRREIEFGVSGQIKTHVGFDVEGGVKDNVAPGEPASTSWIVFSQTMKRFEIESVECQLPGFQFTTEEITDKDLKPLGGSYGLRVRAKTDPLQASGDFNETVRVSVRTGDLIDAESSSEIAASPPEAVDNLGADLVTRELSFQVQVDAPISFYGADLHSEEGLDLGTVVQGDEKITKILIRVRDATPPETMIVKSIAPSILQADIEPSAERPGNYKLTIRVPKDAPQTFFNVFDNFGSIEVADPDRPNFSASFPISGKVLEKAK